MAKAKTKTARRPAPQLPSTAADNAMATIPADQDPEDIEATEVESAEEQPDPDPAPESPPAPLPIWSRPSLKPMSGVVTIRVPIAITGDFVPRRIRTDVRDITPKQRLGLNLLMEGLREESSELASGQVVNNHVNSVRCFLELIADAAVDQLKSN